MKYEYDSLLFAKEYTLASKKAFQLFNIHKKSLKDTSIILVNDLVYIGNAFGEFKVDSAIFYYNKALTLFLKQKRKNESLEAIIRFNLSLCYTKSNRNNEAINGFEIIVKILEKDSLLDNEIYFYSTYNLGVLYDKIKNYNKSILHYKKSFNLINQEEIKALLIPALENISNSYFEIGDTVNAELSFIKLLIVTKDVYDDGYLYFEKLNNVGYFYKKINKLFQAENYFNQAENLLVKNNFNDDTLNISTFYRNVGDLKSKQKNFKSAELYYLKSLNYLLLFKDTMMSELGNLYVDLGNNYSSIFQYKAAEIYYNKALPIFTSLPNKSFTDISIVYRNLGILYNNKHEYKKSELNYFKALGLREKLFGISDKRYISILIDLGDLYMEMDNYSNSEKYLKQAKSLYEKHYGKLDIDYVLAIYNLALLNEKIGKYDDALKLYFDVLQNFKTNDQINSEDYANTLGMIGNVYLDLEDFQSAKKYLTESVNLIKEILGQSSSEYAEKLINLGLYYYKIGSYSISEKYFKESQSIIFAQQGEEVSILGEIENNLGLISLAIGDFNLAEAHYLKSLKIKTQLYGEINLKNAITLTNLGSISTKSKVNYEKSKKYFQDALNIYEILNNTKSGEYLGCLNNYALLLFEMGDYSDSKLIFEKVLKTIETVGSNKSSIYTYCLTNLGMIYLKFNEFDKALSFFSQSFEIINTSFGINHPDYANNLNNLAYVNLLKDDYKASLQYYTKLLKIKKKDVSATFQWLTPDEKNKFWEQQFVFFNNIYDFANKSVEANNGSSELAYNSCLMAKSILLESDIDSRNNIKNSGNDSLQKLMFNLKSEKNNLTKLYTSGNQDFEKINKLKNNVDSIENLISRKNQFKNIKQYSISWQDLLLNLNKEEAAIEFLRFYDFKKQCYSYMAILIASNFSIPKIVKLGDEVELIKYSPETEQNELFSLLWKPLIPYLIDVKTIYYSSDGILNNIPFQALYKEENGQREYVMDKFTLHQLTSTRYLALGLKQKEKELIEPSIALFGGINYNDYPNAKTDTTNHEQSTEAAYLYKNAVVLNRELDSTRAGASYLPGTKKEVEKIAAVLTTNQWQIDVSEGKNATENKIKSFTGSNSKSILHIATHGFAFPDKEEKRKDIEFSMMSGNDKYKASDNPMIRSGLLFGGANMTWQGKGDSLLNTTNEDGVLTAYELSQLDLSNTKLAVLSACETGKGEIQGSEGTFGLKRALKLAGVDNMIVSLWKVPDDATMEMMTLFYTELANTKKPVSSFETAQKAMRIKYPNDPKKWAGFVFVR